jgi:hypothetical protein
MSDVIRFISKSERERARLIQEARAIYDGIFPPGEPLGQQRDGDSGTGAASLNEVVRS